MPVVAQLRTRSGEQVVAQLGIWICSSATKTRFAGFVAQLGTPSGRRVVAQLAIPSSARDL